MGLFPGSTLSLPGKTERNLPGLSQRLGGFVGDEEHRSSHDGLDEGFTNWCGKFLPLVVGTRWA